MAYTIITILVFISSMGLLTVLVQSQEGNISNPVALFLAAVCVLAIFSNIYIYGLNKEIRNLKLGIYLLEDELKNQ